jgi:hypothetical protein
MARLLAAVSDAWQHAQCSIEYLASRGTRRAVKGLGHSISGQPYCWCRTCIPEQSGTKHKRPDIPESDDFLKMFRNIAGLKSIPCNSKSRSALLRALLQLPSVCLPYSNSICIAETEVSAWCDRDQVDNQELLLMSLLCRKGHRCDSGGERPPPISCRRAAHQEYM